MASRGKRGRGCGRADGARASAPSNAAPPAARPAAGARFTPAASYLAHHAPPAPLGQVGTYPAVSEGLPAPQHILEGVLAGLQPVAAPPRSHPVDRTASAPPVAAHSYAARRPPPAAYHGAAPPPAAGPSRTTWPPPAVHLPVPERAAYRRPSPPVAAMSGVPAPQPAPPAAYPAPYPHGYGQPVHPAQPCVPPPSAPPPHAVSPPAIPPRPAVPPRSRSPSLTGSATHTRLPPSPARHPPAPPTPPVPPPHLTSPPPAHVPFVPPTLAHVSAGPAALRAANAATPISASLDSVAFPPPSSAVKAAARSSPSSSRSSNSSSSSSEAGSSAEDSDSDDEERVASALVGGRSAAGSAPPAQPVEAADAMEADSSDESASASEPSSSSSPSSDSVSDKDSDRDSDVSSSRGRVRAHDPGVESVVSDSESDGISDLEEAVQEQVDEEDDHALDTTGPPFDLGSASEAETAADEVGAPDDSLEHAARRKRRRLDSVTTAPDDEDDRASSRAVSLEDEDEDAGLPPRKRARHSSSPPPSPTLASDYADVQPVASAVPPRMPALAAHAFSTSTPTRLSSVLTAPAPSSPIAHASDLLLGMQDEDAELEEGELPVEDAAPSALAGLPHALAASHPAPASDDVAARPASAPSALLLTPGSAVDPALPIGGAAGQVQLALPGGEGQVTVSGLGAVVPLDLSTTPVTSGSSTGVIVHSRPAKLSYKPSPLPQPPVALLDPSAILPAPAKGVYIRRHPVSTVSSDSTPAVTSVPGAGPTSASAAAAKAVYERPANASGKAAKQRAKAAKSGKPPGKLPLSEEEKAERLPPKIYSAFGDFPSLEAASDPAIFAVPHHPVLPGRNLPPPNELCTHGFWPGPPSLKLGKAIFPAPPEPLEEVADDPRPRVDVFIDNSNVLYSFLNWVRARPEAKILSKVQPAGGSTGGRGGGKGKDGPGAVSKSKTVKVVTIGGKKVRLDYRALFALLERGRKIERRVLVGSSTLWQTLEPAVEWGYEISLLQRVPRAEPSTSAATVAQVAQAAATTAANKKRGKNGKAKKPPPPPLQPIVVPPQNSGIKHFKEQAVDELVHLKILETLLDYTPEPLPPLSPPHAPELPLAPAPPESTSAAAGEPAAAVDEGLDIGNASASSVEHAAPLETATAPSAGGGDDVEMGEPERDEPAPPPAPTVAEVADECTGVPAPGELEEASEAAAPAGEASVAVEPAKARFLPSKAFLSGSIQPVKASPAAKPASTGASKFTPAAPKPKIVPVGIKPAPAAPNSPIFAPRISLRDRPTLVIVTGDANSSEYNPGGFLGCVRRALDRGWDVEVVAFTHGISSLWTGEQQVKVTSDGRRRGELRVIDLAQFAEELAM